MLCAALPDSALCKYSLHRAMLCFESLCQTPRRTGAVNSVLRWSRYAMLCVALTDTALYRRSRQCAQLSSALLFQTSPRTGAVGSFTSLWCVLRCSARLRAVQAQSVSCYAILCVVLPDCALCKRSLYHATPFSASFCQTARCEAHSESCYAILCVVLPDSALCKLVDSALCDAVLCVALSDTVLCERSR